MKFIWYNYFLQKKWLWTVLYQLCEWETAADFYWTYTEGRTGEVIITTLVECIIIMIIKRYCYVNNDIEDNNYDDDI